MSREAACITELDSGLRVVSRYVPDLPAVDISVGVLAGSRDEVAGNYPRGTLHYLEHVMPAASEKYAQRTRRLIESIDGFEKANGNYNIFVTQSRIMCSVRVPAKGVAYATDVIGATFCRPLLSQRELLSEMPQIQSERVTNKLYPDRIERNLAPYVAYGYNPLLHPVIGSRRGINEVTIADLRNFHARHIRAGRTVVAFEGNITHDAAVAMVENSFSLTPGYRQPTEMPVYTGGDLRNYAPVLEGVHVALAFKAASTSDVRGDAVSRVLHSLLSADRGPHSIYEGMRGDHGVVYSTNVGAIRTVDAGLLTISYDVLPEYVDASLKDAHAVLARLADGGDRDAFNKVRGAEQKNFKVLQKWKSFGTDNMIDDMWMHGRVMHPEHKSTLRLDVTPEEVRDAAREMLAHPPTFVATGDTDINYMPSAEDVRNIFDSRPAPVHAYGELVAA